MRCAGKGWDEMCRAGWAEMCSACRVALRCAGQGWVGFRCVGQG